MSWNIFARTNTHHTTTENTTIGRCFVCWTDSLLVILSARLITKYPNHIFVLTFGQLLSRWTVKMNYWFRLRPQTVRTTVWRNVEDGFERKTVETKPKDVLKTGISSSSVGGRIGRRHTDSDGLEFIHGCPKKVHALVSSYNIVVNTRTEKSGA